MGHLNITFKDVLWLEQIKKRFCYFKAGVNIYIAVTEIQQISKS